MKSSSMMPMEHDQAQMWKLSADRRSIRMQFGLPVQGTLEPLWVKIDFDAATVEQIIKRLTVLCAQMPRRRLRAAKRHYRLRGVPKASRTSRIKTLRRDIVRFGA